jgi:hypothetical protein
LDGTSTLFALKLGATGGGGGGGDQPPSNEPPPLEAGGGPSDGLFRSALINAGETATVEGTEKLEPGTY